jgi:hypothetical protein
MYTLYICVCECVCVLLSVGCGKERLGCDIYMNILIINDFHICQTSYCFIWSDFRPPILIMIYCGHGSVLLLAFLVSEDN